MFRMSHARPLTDVALAGLVLAGAGSAWLFGSVFAAGRELTATEGFVLHLLVAAGVFFGLGWLVLRQHWRGRQLQQQEIDEAKRKLDTAVGHMSQGLMMFDASQRIALCNRRYIEMYGVSPAVVKPGLSFRELLFHRKETGSFFGDVDEYCTRMTANLAAGKATSLIVKSSGGRSVRIVNEPLEGGGWVATHEDVTERQQLLESHERSEKLLGEQTTSIGRRAQ